MKVLSKRQMHSGFGTVQRWQSRHPSISMPLSGIGDSA